MEIIFDGNMSVDEFIVMYNGKFGPGDTILFEIETIQKLSVADVYNFTAFLEYNYLLPIPTVYSIGCDLSDQLNKGLLSAMSQRSLYLS